MGKIAVFSPDLGGNSYGVTVNSSSAQVRATSGPSLTITTRRSPTECAPEGVFFWANPTGFTVDVAATGSAYEPMRHELDFTWTITGDGVNRTFSTASNMPDEWRNWYANGGHVMSRVFLPGTWTVRCVARHKRTGETAAASVSFTVADPDTYYPTSRTAIVHGGGSVTGAPAHDSGAEFTHFWEAVDWAATKGAPCQVYVRSDYDRLTPRVDLTSADPSILFRVWDVNGGTPRLQYNGTEDGITPSNAHQFDLTSSYAAQLTLWGLNLEGCWDPTTETLTGAGKLGVGVNFRSSASSKLVIYDCTISGHMNNIVINSSGGMCIVESCNTSNWQNFSIYGETAITDTVFGMSDTIMAQSSDAIMGGDKTAYPDYRNNHAGLRFAAMRHWAMSGIDTFSGNGWPEIADTPATPPYRSIQPSIRAWTGTPPAPVAGHYAHWERMVLEGGSGCLNIGPANAGEATTVVNCTIDKVMIVADCVSATLGRIAHTGVTATNLCGTVSDLPCLVTGMWEMLSVYPYTVAQGRVNGVSEAVDEPVRVTGASLYSLRDATDDGSRNVNVYSSTGEFTAATVEGGIRHVPNRTGKSEAAPYTVAGISSWFTPRQTGPTRVGQAKETTYATVVGDLGVIAPDTGSPAIGAGLGSLPPSTDFWGKPRKATPDSGAVES